MLADEVGDVVADRQLSRTDNCSRHYVSATTSPSWFLKAVIVVQDTTRKVKQWEQNEMKKLENQWWSLEIWESRRLSPVDIMDVRPWPWRLSQFLWLWLPRLRNDVCVEWDVKPTTSTHCPSPGSTWPWLLPCRLWPYPWPRLCGLGLGLVWRAKTKTLPSYTLNLLSQNKACL